MAETLCLAGFIFLRIARMAKAVRKAPLLFFEDLEARNER